MIRDIVTYYALFAVSADCRKADAAGRKQPQRYPLTPEKRRRLPSARTRICRNSDPRPIEPRPESNPSAALQDPLRIHVFQPI